MRQSKDSCTAPDLLTIKDAEASIQSAIKPIQNQQVLSLKQCLNRILAEDITAAFNIPRERNSSMDGYAIAFSDLENDHQKFTVVGTSWAGRPYTGLVMSGQCVRIFTGGVLPDNTDTVVMQEQTTQSDGFIQINETTKFGNNVRYPGDDLEQGSIVLEAGTQLKPAELGVLASLGIVSVRVYRQIRVAFFTTGDELRGLTEPLQSGQLYDSNRYSLHALLEQTGVIPIDLGVVPDDPDQLRATLLSAANTSDVIISTGGASVGDADFVHSVMDSIGTLAFWKLAIKPGKPLVFGNIQEKPFFGLPGNPVSVMVTFLILVRPALYQRMGQHASKALQIKVPITHAISRQPGRQEYQRGILSYENDRLVVTPLLAQGSHRLKSMISANCFIIIPAQSQSVSAGESVSVLPFNIDL